MTTMLPNWRHCLSALRIDRYLLGELTDVESREVLAHVSSCPGCAEAVRLQRPAGALPPLRALGRGRRRIWAAAGAGLLAAASLLVLVRPNAQRTKGGGPSIAMFVQHGGEVHRVAPGETVAAGDSIRFAATTSGPSYLAVLSVDPAGHASIYFPVGARAEAIPRGSEVPLPLATRLDETVGEERIVALFCTEAVELQPVRESLARGQPPAPAGCEVVRWSFVKR